MFYFICILLIFTLCSANRDHVSYDFDCNSYQPNSKSLNDCLPRLKKFPEDYKVCQNGSKICYIFINERPFNTIVHDDQIDAIELQKPFPCGKYKEALGPQVSISGTQFILHNRTASANDLCAWAGDSCSFDALVDFIAIKASDNYQFAISGNLIETPQRQCQHEASVATKNDKIVIVGQRNAHVSATTPFKQLIKPFHWGAWFIFGMVLLLNFFVCLCIAWKMQEQQNRSYIDAFLIFFGSNERVSNEDIQRSAEDRSIQNRNSVVLSLYRVSVGAYILIFVLFYEVAVVNFLFQEANPELSHRISKLSKNELKEYGILRDTALESVFISAVDESGRKLKLKEGKGLPWKRCKKYSECFDALKEDKIKFLVSFGTEAKLLLSERAYCEKFAIFETKDTLYEFNAGWLYNEKVNKTRRKEIDRQLLALRINGEVEAIDRRLVDEEECHAKTESYIGPFTILIPCLTLVFPPLFGSLLVMLLWGKARYLDRRKSLVNSAAV